MSPTEPNEMGMASAVVSAGDQYTKRNACRSKPLLLFGEEGMRLQSKDNKTKERER
jgi:hypothetical protein